MKTSTILKLVFGIALAGIFSLLAAPSNPVAAAPVASYFSETETVLEITDKNKPHKPKKEKIVKPKRRKHVKPQRTNHGPRKPIFPEATPRSKLYLWFVGL